MDEVDRSRDLGLVTLALQYIELVNRYKLTKN